MQEEALLSIKNRLGTRADYTSLEFIDEDDEEEEEVPHLNKTDFYIIEHFIETYNSKMKDWHDCSVSHK